MKLHPWFVKALIAPKDEVGPLTGGGPWDIYLSARPHQLEELRAQGFRHCGGLRAYWGEAHLMVREMGEGELGLEKNG